MAEKLFQARYNLNKLEINKILIFFFHLILELKYNHILNKQQFFVQDLVMI